MNDEPFRPDWRKAPSFKLWLKHPLRCFMVWATKCRYTTIRGWIKRQEGEP